LYLFRRSPHSAPAREPEIRTSPGRPRASIVAVDFGVRTYTSKIYAERQVVNLRSLNSDGRQTMS
jgi:hypothetical protein